MYAVVKYVYYFDLLSLNMNKGKKVNNLYALVVFEDGIYHICQQKNIKCYEDGATAKYNGSRYTASVLFLSCK